METLGTMMCQFVLGTEIMSIMEDSMRGFSCPYKFNTKQDHEVEAKPAIPC